MSRPPADPVARWLALIVAHHLVTGPERPDLPPLAEGITAVEAHAVGELATGVVVTMAGQVSPRYFIVWVAEFTTRR